LSSSRLVADECQERATDSTAVWMRSATAWGWDT
jgi:hypothetical protein